MSLAKVLERRSCLLLDFDGPVCSVFTGLSSREAVQTLVAQIDWTAPVAVAASQDPFDVLNAAARVSTDVAERVEYQLTQIECQAIKSASPTPAVDSMICHARDQQRKVAIVSNNSEAAIRRYLSRRCILPAIQAISARTNGDVTQLKPSPYLLERVTGQLGVAPDDCVFIGDSNTDISAGHSAGIPTVAFANRPGKQSRFSQLQPAAIITDMVQVTQAMDRPQSVG